MLIDPAPVRHDAQITSLDAARSLPIAVRSAQAKKILRALAENYESGLTSEEIELATGIRGNSVRPLVLQLMDLGLVVRIDETRKTTSGRKALIHKIAP